MNIKLTDPKLFLTFEGNDLEPGHSTSQTIESDYIINYSFSVRQQYLSSLKSASDQIGLQIKRKCASIEDIIATDGNVKAVLKDGEETIFTGYIATSYKWTVADHGEQTLSITIEGVGTRLLNQPFIETGKHFFDCSASAAVYSIVHPLGITIHEGDERKILQNVGKEVEAGDTCRDLLDALFYECNAVYWFNNLGELCIDVINPSTIGVQTVDSADLYVVGAEAVSLSKSLRSYKGARITYKALGSAGGYLVYRNTTGATATRVCNLELKAGEYFDGAGIYTAAEWSDITADTFREPTLIGAVNAASESQIVGSGKIVNIANLSPDVVADTGIDVTFEAAGGPYIKMLAHNTTGSTKTITRMDLYADVVYEMSDGVIRTQIDGSTAGKTLLEEELTWIHDKENASKHANLLSQYYQYASATYTFRTKKDITPGSVIRLHEDLFSGLDVYVLITARDLSAGAEIWKYTAVGISNFDLSESAYHGTTEPAKQSGAQGPQGEPGATAEVQYAIGDSLINPPGDAMQWASADMLWGGQTMFWNTGTWEDTVPTPERGKYIWMRTRIGDAPWQYSRLTGSTSWDAENLGVCLTATPTQSKEGLGIIPGDYFVAGATFTDSGVTYNAGYAYTYNGTSWTGLDLTNEENARKALDLLSELSTANIQIPSSDSAYSVWLWTKNFVAQNAVIENLFAQHITILENGCIHSEYYNDDGTIKKTATATTDSQEMTIESFDDEKWFNTVGDVLGTFSWEVTNVWAGGCDFTPIVGNPLPAMSSDDMWDYYGIEIPDARHADYGDTVTVTVISTSGAIYGFWLGADGTFKCHSATAENLRIMGDSVFQGRFDCDVIKTETDTASSVTVSVTDRTRTQGSTVASALQNAGFSSGVKIPVIVSGGANPIKFISYSGTDVYFFDENFNNVNIAAYFTVKGYREDTGTTAVETNANKIGRFYVDKGTYLRYWVNYYIDSNYTITAYNGGNRLTVNIPNSGSNLSFGQLFYGPQTTVGGIACYPVYMAKGN